MTTSSEFVRMINHPLYEMSVEYPHTIRRIDNKKEISENEDKDGYLVVSLNVGNKNKLCKKHRLIAEQFLLNPDNLPMIDHINHDKKDNRISNLRFVSNSTNQYNRLSTRSVHYEFIEDIPDDAVVVDFYDSRTGRKEFDIDKYYYYFDEELNKDIFYNRINENLYKILHINMIKGGLQAVYLIDKNNRNVGVYINKFKQQHDLI